MKTYIGIDNGIGTCGEVTNDMYFLFNIPTRQEQDYTKTKKIITRIDAPRLYGRFALHIEEVFVLLERPMINPMRFKQSIIAARNYEAVLITLERCNFPYQVIDSKEWQREFFPSCKKGQKLDTKALSLQVGKRLFPNIEGNFKDYDGLLIAEYARRKGY